MARPGPEDRSKALRRVLGGLVVGDDAATLVAAVADLHPKNNTFPGEVFMVLGAQALEAAGATEKRPVAYEGLRETYLPELEFRGKQNRKIQYAILTSAALRGGLEPDLLDEVAWWNDDYWQYALFAAIALIRAAAAHAGITAEALAIQVAERHGIQLD